MKVINESIDLLTQRRMLVIGADSRLAMAPEVIHRIEVRASLGQPQEPRCRALEQAPASLGQCGWSSHREAVPRASRGSASG